MSQLTDSQRDELYTRTCHAVTAVGAANESLFLARLVLLLSEAVGDAETVAGLIDAAQEGLALKAQQDSGTA